VEFTMAYALRLNALLEKELLSDDIKLYFLHKYTDHLDKYCSQNILMPFHDLIEHRTYLIEKGYPAAKEWTVDEYIVAEGKWQSSEDSLHFLRKLKNKLESKPTRFGWFPNHYKEVIIELDYAIEFFTQALTKNAKFNFCIVSVPLTTSEKFDDLHI